MRNNDGFTLLGIGSAIIGLIGLLVFSPVITLQKLKSSVP